MRISEMSDFLRSDASVNRVKFGYFFMLKYVETETGGRWWKCMLQVQEFGLNSQVFGGVGVKNHVCFTCRNIEMT